MNPSHNIITFLIIAAFATWFYIWIFNIFLKKTDEQKLKEQNQRRYKEKMEFIIRDLIYAQSVMKTINHNLASLPDYHESLELQTMNEILKINRQDLQAMAQALNRDLQIQDLHKKHEVYIQNTII